MWSWPFPEGCTVAQQLEISGASSVGMGTAPDLWNTIMGLMVGIVPRSWWLRRAFSQGLADFSRPLVAITDPFCGETHAMRVDVTGISGARVSAVQTHTSFRRVVGQCAAEFTLALLEGQPTGVWTPEALFEQTAARTPLLTRLLEVEGTTSASFSRPPQQKS